MRDREFYDLQEIIRRVRDLEAEVETLKTIVAGLEESVIGVQGALSEEDIREIAATVVRETMQDYKPEEITLPIHDHSGTGEIGDTTGGPAFAQNGAKLINQNPTP